VCFLTISFCDSSHPSMVLHELFNSACPHAHCLLLHSTC
jgi:hypothetical protein